MCVYPSCCIKPAHPSQHYSTHKYNGLECRSAPSTYSTFPLHGTPNRMIDKALTHTHTHTHLPRHERVGPRSGERRLDLAPIVVLVYYVWISPTATMMVTVRGRGRGGSLAHMALLSLGTNVAIKGARLSVNPGRHATTCNCPCDKKPNAPFVCVWRN